MILIVVLVVLAILFFSTEKKETFLPIYSYITEENDRLYRLIELTTNILQNEKIPYSITGNILLSAATVGKLQRGDSTAILLVPINYIPQLLTLSDFFLKSGVGFNDLPDGSLLIGSSISSAFTSDVSIQILPVELAGDKWIVLSKRLSYDEWYGKDDLFPTKAYAFDTFAIQGPKDPLPYLQRNFWSDNGINQEMIENNGIIGNNGIITKVRSGQTVDIRDALLVPRSGSVPIILDKNNSFYGSNRLQVYPPDGRKMILMGNGRPLLVPSVRSIIPRRTGWRRFLWSDW